MILILMQSRSGSSLVASIFQAHGFNTRHAPGGSYCNYEHVPVKEWMRRHKKEMNFKRGEFVDYVPGVDLVVRTKDCVKTGVEHWPLFKPLNPRVVTVRRDPECILASLMEKNPSDPDEMARLIERRNEMLDQARDEADGVDVFTDGIIAGDLGSIEFAFEYYGLEFDAYKAATCVDPSKWHFRPASV